MTDKTKNPNNNDWNDDGKSTSTDGNYTNVTKGGSFGNDKFYTENTKQGGNDSTNSSNSKVSSNDKSSYPIVEDTNSGKGPYSNFTNPTSSSPKEETNRSNSNVQTKGNIPNLYSFHRKYDVQLVPQLTGFSCWAAGAAMLVGYRDSISINPDEIARGIGYWAQYIQGLLPEDTRMFQYWGLIAESPQTYNPTDIRDLLIRTKGPLWVATHEGCPHIRVITGISGNGTADGTTLYINDPWERGMTTFGPSNRGSVYTETFAEFEAKQRELAYREQEVHGLYIAHL